MKTNVHLLTVLLLVFVMAKSTAQTTVTNGNWSNPVTWGGVPPTGTGTVIINHIVTLDIDYSHTSGSITINSTGALTGNSSMRLFALNYPSGTATLTVNDSFNVARVLLVSNTINNYGTFQADSLLSSATLTNNSGATLNAAQFTIYTGGTFNNNGSVISMNIFNMESVTNTGSISANDFTNAKSFTNASTGVMSITHDFSNIDSIVSPAVFTNNGSVTVTNDWHNGNEVNGSGEFSIGNYTWNSGTMTGTFDFCDQTGGNIDLNTGTAAGTITYCSPTGIETEELSGNMLVTMYPNPFSSQTTLHTDINLQNATLTVDNIFGQTVAHIKNINGQTVTLYRDNLPAGMYVLRLTQDSKIIATNKITITD